MNKFDSGYYTDQDLRSGGFKSVGTNVQIAKNCTIVGLENISIGDHVRIDSYSSLIAPPGGYIRIGSNIHIAAYSYLAAGAGIILDDFSGISQRVSLYTKTDDYSGKYMTNPTVPEEYTNVSKGLIHLQEHVIIGANTVILPGVTIGTGSSVGAQSLVTKCLDDWGVYFGCPAKRLKARSKELLSYQDKLKERADL